MPFMLLLQQMEYIFLLFAFFINMVQDYSI